MEFGVLGRLTVRVGGQPRTLTRTKPRVVLALLLARANQAVPRAHLVAELWRRTPPRSAVANLHTYMWAVRGVLPPERLAFSPGGYRLTVEEHELDALRHRRLAERGRTRLQAGDVAAAATDLAAAAALWRGRPLADLPPTPGLTDWVDHLDEQGRAAARDWTDARLLLGLGEELVGELRRAVTEDSLSERVHAQLIIALYRAGRVGEALDAYADARRTLAEELGIEPGHALQRLHEAILRRRLSTSDLGGLLAHSLV